MVPHHPNYTALHARRRFPNTDDANRLADTAHEGLEVGGNDVSVLQVTGEDTTVYYTHL